MIYDIIVADPPWRFASNSTSRPGRNAMRHYDRMTDAEICDIPVAAWAADAALLLLWTTAPMLERSLAVPRAWGFKYKSQLVWVKDKIGCGYWARNRHEIVLICTRGRFPCPRPAPFSDSIIAGQQREHSRKPDALLDRVDAIWPDARKLEMFARQHRSGWAAIGDETDKFTAASALGALSN